MIKYSDISVWCLICVKCYFFCDNILYHMISATMTMPMSSDKSMVMMTQNLLQYEERRNRLFWLLTFMLAVISSTCHMQIFCQLSNFLLIAILFLSYVNKRRANVEIDNFVTKSNDWPNVLNMDVNNRPIIGNKYWIWWTINYYVKLNRDSNPRIGWCSHCKVTQWISGKVFCLPGQLLCSVDHVRGCQGCAYHHWQGWGVLQEDIWWHQWSSPTRGKCSIVWTWRICFCWRTLLSVGQGSKWSRRLLPYLGNL